MLQTNSEVNSRTHLRDYQNFSVGIQMVSYSGVVEQKSKPDKAKGENKWS